MGKWEKSDKHILFIIKMLIFIFVFRIKFNEEGKLVNYYEVKVPYPVPH